MTEREEARIQQIKIVTLEVNGEPCLFREPRLPDLKNLAAEGMLQRDFPDQARYHAAIVLLGTCYIPDADEKGIDAIREIAQLVRDDFYGFGILLDDFKTAFSDSPMWEPQAKQGE